MRVLSFSSLLLMSLGLFSGAARSDDFDGVARLVLNCQGTPSSYFKTAYVSFDSLEQSILFNGVGPSGRPLQVALEILQTSDDQVLAKASGAASGVTDRLLIGVHAGRFSSLQEPSSGTEVLLTVKGGRLRAGAEQHWPLDESWSFTYQDRYVCTVR